MARSPAFAGRYDHAPAVARPVWLITLAHAYSIFTLPITSLFTDFFTPLFTK
jgi:hypothetical protein